MIKLRSHVKLLLGTVILTVAGICAVVPVTQFLPAFSFHMRSSVRILGRDTSHVLPGIVQLTKLPARVIKLRKQSYSRTVANTDNKKATLSGSKPIPGPPPNLPWSQDDLKVTSNTLMHLPWVKDLWAFLNNGIDSTRPIAITTSNYEFLSTLINWLAHAMVHLRDHSIKNLLVISMDNKIHELLKSKNISSLYLPHENLIVSIHSGQRHPGLLQVMISRLIVMRLINYWGFDVINYDNDAFVLKNPQEFFDLYPNSHVIGSEANNPPELHDKWGVTLCMGVILIRASPETETLWKSISNMEITDDQKQLNMALNSLNLEFDKQESDSIQPWQGRAPITINNHQPSTLTVTVIPMKNICKGAACKARNQPDYYVWHQGAHHDVSKVIQKAGRSRVWLLRKDWSSIVNSSKTGKKWLQLLIKKKFM